MAGRAWFSVAAAAVVVSCNAAGPAPPPAKPSGAEGQPQGDRAGDVPAPGVGRPSPPTAPELTNGYREPSADIVALVDARPTPHAWVSPTTDRIVLADYDAHPSIAVVSEPFERLAGIRIDIDHYAGRRTRMYESLTIVSLADGAKTRANLPEDAQFATAAFSPDGSRLAVTQWVEHGVQLWVVDLATGDAHRIGDRELNTVLFTPTWMPSSQALLASLRPQGAGPAPERPTVPSGPTALDTDKAKATNPTYADLLSNRVDELLFEHFTTGVLSVIDLDGGVVELGPSEMLEDASPSPDGQYVLVTHLKRPFSYSVPYSRFPQAIEVRDLHANVVRVAGDLPLAEEIPIEGVRQGARGVHWQPTADATLAWREALDGGDPNAVAEHRDRLMTHAAPFADTPEERLRTVQRLRDVSWTERAGELMVTEYDRDRRWVTTHLYGPTNSGTAGVPTTGSRVLFDRSARDAYGDPGDPVHRSLASGHDVVVVDDGKIYLSGSGATPEGDRPFLASMDLASGAREELMRASGDEHVEFVAFGAPTHDRWLVTRETADTPPDYFLEGKGGPMRLTELPHPHPQLSGIEKRVLKYNRRDGVALSGTLYLPANYGELPEGSKRLPLVVWAYPFEFNDADTAGQVRATPHGFTRLQATSPLMFLTQGYAVLSGAAMPIVGDPETMNDTFIKQVVWSAEAAVDAVVAEGVADRDRVGVGGHSYGAFMTANLLAHSDIFRAGLARSGAYNRSLTPFGFQSERRTLWEAVDTYVRVSPLFAADKIDEPILLVHGEVDSNSGTFPLQSTRLFHALQGTGGTARLVVLPQESHGYAARESVLHVLAESFEWFDTHVKNAEPRTRKAVARPG